MRPTRYYSNKQEKHVAKEVKGKQVANSGATAFNKGDVVTDNFLIECKTCTKEQKSFTLKKNGLPKMKKKHLRWGKILMHLRLISGMVYCIT